MEDQRLIHLVQQFPQLYDVQHEHYADQPRKQSAWEEIGGKLGVSADECQKRWTHILNNERVRFEQEFAFLKERTGTEQQVSNTVPGEAIPGTSASDSVPQETNAPTIGPVLIVREETNAQPTAPVVQREETNAAASARVTDRRESNAQREASESESSEESANEEPQPSGSTKSRKRKRCVCCTCSESIKKYFLYKFQRLSERREKDELDHYFEHIEESVRYLPQMLQWDAKREISRVVSDLEYRVISCGYDDDYDLDE